MTIELTKEQQKMLISLIENTSFAGKDAEIVVELKKALNTNIEELAKEAKVVFKK